MIDAPVDATPDASTLNGIVAWFQFDDDTADELATNSARPENRGRCNPAHCPAMTAGVQGTTAYLFSNDVVVAEERGIRMPSFFAYFFWASLILVPLFALLTLLPIAPILRPF